MTHSSVQGNSLDITLKVDSWVGKGVDQRTLGPIATPYQCKETQGESQWRREVQGSFTPRGQVANATHKE